MPSCTYIHWAFAAYMINEMRGQTFVCDIPGGGCLQVKFRMGPLLLRQAAFGYWLTSYAAIFIMTKPTGRRAGIVLVLF